MLSSPESLKTCPFCSEDMMSSGFQTWCPNYKISSDPKYFKCSSAGTGRSGITVYPKEPMHFRLALLPFILYGNEEGIQISKGEYNYIITLEHNKFIIDCQKLSLPEYQESLINKINTILIFL